MTYLNDVSIRELEDFLESVESEKQSRRIRAAISYKKGRSVSEIATDFDVVNKTIYNWLTRLDEEPLPDAVQDRRQFTSGRPRKADEKELQEIRDALRQSPIRVGYESPTWTPSLLQTWLAEEYDLEYTRTACRRMMREAGLELFQYSPGELEQDSGDVSDMSSDHKYRRGVWKLSDEEA